jgi:hypothetical protein
MELRDYPTAIAKAANHAKRLAGDVWEARKQLATVNWQIESAIATDTTCRNDQERKAKRLEMQQGDGYCKANETLHRAETKLENAQIQLNLLRDTFRVEILESRERIARLEADRMIA